MLRIDVVAVDAIVLRRDDDIESARIDARVEDLHGERVAGTPVSQSTRDERGAAAAADREVGPWRCQRAAFAVANRRPRADREPRRERIPRLAQDARA